MKNQFGIDDPYELAHKISVNLMERAKERDALETMFTITANDQQAVTNLDKDTVIPALKVKSDRTKVEARLTALTA